MSGFGKINLAKRSEIVNDPVVLAVAITVDSKHSAVMITFFYDTFCLWETYKVVFSVSMMSACVANVVLQVCDINSTNWYLGP